MPGFDEFQFAFDHVEKLLDRRQQTTSFYLTVNTGVLAITGLLVKDSRLPVEWLSFSVLLLLCAGLIACLIWRSLLGQYEVLLGWWYACLRDMESEMSGSKQLITEEYREFYGKEPRSGKHLGMTGLEQVLNGMFILLYVAFALGILLSWLWMAWGAVGFPILI